LLGISQRLEKRLKRGLQNKKNLKKKETQKFQKEPQKTISVFKSIKFWEKR
jgi:hypothetical protein